MGNRIRKGEVGRETTGADGESLAETPMALPRPEVVSSDQSVESRTFAESGKS